MRCDLLFQRKRWGTPAVFHDHRHEPTRVASRRQCNLALVLLGMSLGCFGPLNAAVYNPGLFSTGVDNQGNLLPLGSIDPHYTLIQNPDPLFPGPSASVFSGNGTGGLGPNSEWIGPVCNPTCLEATYIYRTTFDLTGIDPSAVVIAGKWATDNFGLDILINGSSTGFTAPDDRFAGGSFTISGGFVGGINTLDFVVLNGTIGTRNPTALRVDLSSTTPEPGTLSLLVIAGCFLFLRRFGKALQFLARPRKGN